jgi:hypothetical protein
VELLGYSPNLKAKLKIKTGFVDTLKLKVSCDFEKYNIVFEYAVFSLSVFNLPINITRYRPGD